MDQKIVKIGFVDVGPRGIGGVWVSIDGRMAEMNADQARQLGAHILRCAGCDVAFTGAQAPVPNLIEGRILR